MTITGTPKDFTRHMARRLGAKRKTGAGSPARKGAPRGSLHAGPGGWDQVIGRLVAAGVLGPYRRAGASSGEPKLAVALLYREGLQIKRAGQV